MSRLSALKKAIVLVRNAPHFWRQWNRVWRAQREGNWATIEEIMSDFHQRSFETPQTRFLHGCALAHFSRWEEALAQFERIGATLDDVPSEAVRWVNHAIALVELGRREEAVDLLKGHVSSDWPPSELRKAQELSGGDPPRSELRDRGARVTD